MNILSGDNLLTCQIFVLISILAYIIFTIFTKISCFIEGSDTLLLEFFKLSPQFN